MFLEELIYNFIRHAWNSNLTENPLNQVKDKFRVKKNTSSRPVIDKMPELIYEAFRN